MGNLVCFSSASSKHRRKNHNFPPWKSDIYYFALLLCEVQICINIYIIFKTKNTFLGHKTVFVARHGGT